MPARIGYAPEYLADKPRKPLSYKQWQRFRDELRHAVVQGSAAEATNAWFRLDHLLDRKDEKALESWLDLQIELIDGSSGDISLKRIALLQLCTYPVFAHHERWCIEKRDQGAFTDRALREALGQAILAFRELRQERDEELRSHVRPR